MNIGQYLSKSKSSPVKKKKSDVALITHKNCPDGAAAAVLIKKIFSQVQVEHCSHVQLSKESIATAQQVNENGKMIFCDICPDEETLKKVIEIVHQKNAFLAIYDHHQSNRWVEKYGSPHDKSIEIIFDENRCGSKIVYDHFLDTHKEILLPYQEYIMLTNDRDLWLQKDPRSYRLSLLHKILEDQRYVKRFLKNPIFGKEEKEENILDFFIEIQRKEEEKLLKKIQIRQDKEDYRYGVIYGNGDSSTILNKAIVRFKLEYALLVDLNTKKVSLRGKGNMNCAAYAEKYGGGGHPCASGFHIRFNTPDF